jgi:L-alanine-DL-glutamate epimerase-like enolase superfamily enzyme
MRDAMRDVAAQDFLFHPAQCGAHRGDLRHDVDAIALVRDHAGQAAHLALDAAESFERFRLAVLLVVLAHAVYIPPGGIEGKMT